MKISVIFDVINRATTPLRNINKSIASIDTRLTKAQISVVKFNKSSELMGLMADTANTLSQPFIQFESTMAELSAITGIVGDELQELGQNSRKVGVDAGLGAVGAVEAYKLLASQIDVSKIGISGLKNLHQETITLAQASGMTMADSANSMAGTINQFGLAAEESVLYP